MYIGIHVKCPLFLYDFNYLNFSRHIFEKENSQNIKFHENPSSGSRVVACGRTEGRTDGRTDMKKMIVDIREFANAPTIFYKHAVHKSG